MTTTPDCANCPIHHLRQQTTPNQKLRPQRKFTIHTELDIICKYQCEKQSSLHLGKQYKCPPDTIQNILRKYGQSPRSLRDAQLLRRGSEDLTFPLSKEVPQLHKDPTVRNFLPYLIAIMLLTDGGAGKRKGRGHYITFTNKAESLHAIFADLIHYQYNQPPSGYFKEYWSKAGKQGHKAYYTTYNRKKDTEIMLNELLKLSPIYRTRPKRNQAWEEFLKEKPQPSIQFLFDPKIPNKVHSFGLRLAMSAEGAISPMFNDDSAYPFPHLTFGCKHPILKKQWERYFHLHEIPLKPTNEMLESGKLETSKRFLKRGGFFRSVKCRDDSYYRGIDRQHVLKAVLIDRKDYPLDTKLSRKEKHEKMRIKALEIAQKETGKKR